ncbi:MAG: hypothetical protein IPM63_14800 [Acidobacteriota bacterium]|nr:MAG: hypothetical protein IPM63_14800 [Acidobacteriota bacterium]
MSFSRFASIFVLLIALLSAIPFVAQAAEPPVQTSQEISDKEGIPVLIKHLPEWETKADTAIFVTKFADLQTYLNEREVLNRIDFLPGTEAVIASYPAGKLVIIEFATPQASVDADQRVTDFVSSSETDAVFFYRRIGNYNVFLFDGSDEAAANALFDQIKYEKVVQWLGAEPFYGPEGESERDFIVGASSLFIATVVVIASGFTISAVIGVIVGILYFVFRERRRSNIDAFSDAGGMTRLNLDGLSVQEVPGRLLNK